MARIPAARWLTWWYLAIGLGFLLLALHQVLVGARFWQVALRLVIAAGFLLLAYAQSRSGQGQQR